MFPSNLLDDNEFVQKISVIKPLLRSDIIILDKLIQHLKII